MKGVQEGHRARKRFGQNFLHDPTVIGRIVSAVRPQPNDHIVEIGPGLGAITAPLLDTGCRLTAIEIDRDLAQRQRDNHSQNDRFTLIEQDVLKVDLAALCQDAPGGARIVGNLPYNISTPVLFKLLATPNVRDMHFMLQREVVDRMTASAGDKNYGRLSVAVAATAAALKIIDVKPGAFNPPPKVQSAVVRVTPRSPDFMINNEEAFDQVVRHAFAMRRKTLSNSLAGLLTRDQITACGIDAGWRAETIPPSGFATLANLLAANWAAEPEAPNTGQ